MQPPKRRMSAYDGLMFCVFAVLWIIPITYVGSASTDIPDLPRIMKHQYRVACLFTKHVRSWSTYHVETQTGGSDEWVEMPIEGIFDMPVFGYRTKLHRLCGKSFRGRMARPRMKEITNYIKKRRREVRPDAPPLDAVRVSRVSHPIKVLAKEVGRFKRLPLKHYLAQKRHRYLFGEQRWDGKKPKNVTWRSKRKRPKGKKRAFPELKRIPKVKPPPGSGLPMSPKKLQHLNNVLKRPAPATEAPQ